MIKKMLVVIAGLALGLTFFVPANVDAATKKTAVKDYDYQLVDQQPSGTITMQPGEVKTVWIELKNTGTKTWYVDGPNPVRLGVGSLYAPATGMPDYNYLVSEFAYFNSNKAQNNWISWDRASLMSDGNSITPEIKPGWNTRFQFDIKAPLTPGVYNEYFTPVAENLTWMKDMGIYWQIKVLGVNSYSPTEIYAWPGQGDSTATAQIGDSIYVGLDTANNNYLITNTNSSVLQYTGRELICDGYNQNINMDIATCNATATRALYEFRAIANGVSQAGVQGFNLVTVTVGGNNNVKNNYYQDANGDPNLIIEQSQNGTNLVEPMTLPLTASNNGATYKIKQGDSLKLENIYAGNNTAMPTYDSSILNLSYTPDTNCVGNNTCVAMPTYPWFTFMALKEGYSKIEWNSGTTNDFYLNIIVDRDYYLYNTDNIYYTQKNVKQGDIVIVKLANPGDGGYVFDDPKFPAGRVKLIDHTHFAPTNPNVVGDFGSDQWSFEILDSDRLNWIQIDAYRPWEKGNTSAYITEFYLTINQIPACEANGTPC